jgi:hypothetical protein
MEVSGELHSPAALPPGKQSTASIGRQIRSGLWRRESSPTPSGNLTPAAQPVARRCTDWDVPAHVWGLYDTDDVSALSSTVVPHD